MKNQQILEKIRTGNSGEAIKELYQYFPAVRSFILSYGGDEEDARDIFQEAMMIFYKNARKSEFQLTASASTYVFSVCKYLWKDELKKKNRKVSFELDDNDLAEKDTVHHFEEEKRYVQIDGILRKLGEKCLEVLQSFYYHKFSMEQIAEKFGYRNVNTAKTQKYKCIERARKMAVNL